MAAVPIDSVKHPALRAAAALTGPLPRAAEGRYLVEGAKLVTQAAAVPGALLEVFWVAEDSDRPAVPDAVTQYTLPREMLPKLIGTHYQTSLTAVGVVRRAPLAAMPAAGLLLLAEDIQDPRNVGVLVRTCEAAGVAAFGLSDTSADPYSRQAVRSTTGSILRQPLHLTADLPATLRQLKADGVTLVGTSAKAEFTCWATDLTGNVAVVLGNETTGLSVSARSCVDTVVSLPMHGGASSLNVTVAAGILLYEALRQRAL